MAHSAPLFAARIAMLGVLLAGGAARADDVPLPLPEEGTGPPAPAPVPTPGAAPAPARATTVVEPGAMGSRWSFGPAIGGGVAIGATVQFRASRNVWFDFTPGLRLGVSLVRVYPNIAFTGGVNTGWGRRRMWNGVFLSGGASAPVGFFDAWIGGGWSMELFSDKGDRFMNLQVGPAVFLARELPPEVGLGWPGFLYVRAALPFDLGEPPGGR